MYITDSNQLQTFIEKAASARVVAIDTEFLRERTYHPKLCLIQVGYEGGCAAIDPLALEDLSCLVDLLVNPDVTKVFHACSQDLEVIDHALGCHVHPVFDTQLAAAFLGHRMQMGYGALVEAYTGVHLPQAASLTDWSHRPLDEEQLEYAEDDVRYLPSIYQQMTDELVRLNRLGWVLPEMEDLADPARYRHDPRKAYLKLKRSGSLTRRQLSVAREVCAWRDLCAENRDIPRKWVLSDEVIVEICKLSPVSVDRLLKIRGMDHLSERDAQTVVEAVRRGRACPIEKTPRQERRPRPSADLESVMDLMYALVRLVSERSGVATQLIATRDDLHEFALDPASSRLSQSWRSELVGDLLKRLLDGQVGLTVKEGRVEIL